MQLIIIGWITPDVLDWKMVCLFMNTEALASSNKYHPSDHLAGNWHRW